MGTYYYLFVKDDTNSSSYYSKNNQKQYLEKKEEAPVVNNENYTNAYTQDVKTNDYNYYDENTSKKINKEILQNEEKIQNTNNNTNVKEQTTNKLENQNIKIKEENKTAYKTDSKPIANSKKSLNPIKEYQRIGKNSKYEPDLSSEYVKVYVMNGKSLTEYRKGLLKNMLEPVVLKSKDYNLTIFIQMLPNNNMNLSIYNKDIIFSDKKKSYKYMDTYKLEDIALFFNKNESNNFTNQSFLEQLNSKIKREDIIKKVIFTGYTDYKGSVFSNHMLGLSRSLSVARYFFPFSEIIEIRSVGKDDYPMKDKTKQQREKNRKVKIDFDN